jgi:hypothetical protein
MTLQATAVVGLWDEFMEGIKTSNRQRTFVDNE